MSTPGMSRTDVGWYPKSPTPKLKSETAWEGSGRMTPDIKGMDAVIRKNEEIEKSFVSAEWAAEQFAASIGTAFSDIKSIKDFANAVKNAAKQVILSVIAQSTAENMAKAVRGSKTWWGAIIQGAAAAAATSALFNAVPSFAEGGIVKGKQLVIAGDNPSGVEAMIPKEMWGQLGGQNINIQGVVRGRDLYWVLKNQENYMNKVI